MKYNVLMECRAGARHAFKTVLIIKLPNGTFKVQKYCPQCKSEKYQIWNLKGIILSSGAYKHSAPYREFLNEHTPVEARMAILGSDIRKVEAPNGGKDRPRLRLVQKTSTRGRKKTA